MMRKITSGLVALGLLMSSSHPSLAIYRGSNVPQTDTGEQQLPNETIKLKQGEEEPPPKKNSTKKTVDRQPEKKVVRQRQPSSDQQPSSGQGMSPEAAQTLGTVIGVGVGIGMGMGHRGGGDDMRGGGGSRMMRDH
jgi:hypothetical protein